MSALAIRVLAVAKRAYGTGSLLRKHGSWYGSWRASDGRRTMRKLGALEQLSKKQAEAKLQQMILISSSEMVGAADLPSIQALGAMLIARLESRGRKRSHIEGVRYHLAAHIEPLLGELAVNRLTERDVERLISRMIRKGRAPKTIRNVIGTLHSVVAIAVERQWIERNPCTMVRLPEPRRQHDIRFLTAAELERVLGAAPPADAGQAERDWWPVLRLLVLTAAMSGMRLGELRALRWSDLDMAAMKVRVRYSFVRGEMGAPKSRRSVRAVPLASRLVSELDEHHKRTLWNREGDLVLAHPHTGRPLDRVRLLSHFKAALQRANVRPVRIHDLRHTFATMVAASGQVSLRTLQEWMGHEDARTTQIYADYMPGEREQQLIDAAFARTTDTNRAPILATHDPEDPTNTL